MKFLTIEREVFSFRGNQYVCTPHTYTIAENIIYFTVLFNYYHSHTMFYNIRSSTNHQQFHNCQHATNYYWYAAVFVKKPSLYNIFALHIFHEKSRIIFWKYSVKGKFFMLIR